MKKFTILAIALMMSGLMTTGALAAATQGENKGPLSEQQPQAVDSTQVKDNQGQKKGKTEAIQTEIDYRQKREEMKKRRDAASELRKQNIQTDSAGNTGM